MASSLISHAGEYEAIPLIVPTMMDNNDKGAVNDLNEVFTIALKKFPIPHFNWNVGEFREFKERAEIREQRLALKIWLRELAKQGLSASELEEQIEYNIITYENSLKRKKIQFSYSTIEVIVKSSLDAIENLFKLKWGSIANSFFDLKRNKAKFDEAKSELPGKQVAYIESLQKFHNDNYS